VSAAELPLHRAFPRLRETLPWRRFTVGPTPVAPLALAGLPGDRVWIKLDDHSCPLYGGNKPRKLEFVLGHAASLGARTLVTTGGLGTNHGLATTILGRSLGMASVLVLVDQPVTPEVRETLRLQWAWGARQVAVGGPVRAALGVLGALAGAAVRGGRPYLVATGGSSARGNLGFVSAGLELAEQVRAGELPEPAEIYLPVGSGGSAAGLLLGLRLGGLASRIHAVLVTDILPPSPARLRRAARASLALLRRADPSVPALEIPDDRLALDRGQLGPGYGAATPAARAAKARAREAGLRIETTYGAKALAALQAREEARAGAGAPVLFWHTYNGVDVAAQAPRRAEEADLPRAVRRRIAHAR